jgi:hypothetical protein
MTLPDRIDAKWIDSLGDTELVQAEWELHKVFSRTENDEKKVHGTAMGTANWSELLMAAWMRWSLVQNATRARGLHPRYRR